MELFQASGLYAGHSHEASPLIGLVPQCYEGNTLLVAVKFPRTYVLQLHSFFFTLLDLQQLLCQIHKRLLATPHRNSQHFHRLLSATIVGIYIELIAPG